MPLPVLIPVFGAKLDSTPPHPILCSAAQEQGSSEGWWQQASGLWVVVSASRFLGEPKAQISQVSFTGFYPIFAGTPCT